MRRFLPLLPLLAALLLLANYLFSHRSVFQSSYDGQYWWNRFENSQYARGEKSDFILSDAEFNAVKGYRLVIDRIDPTNFVAGHPPLANYFIGLSLLLFHNPYYFSAIFGVLSALLFFLLARYLIKNTTVAGLLTLAFVSEPLFLDQLTDSLLDIYQLFFGLLALYFYFLWLKKDYFSYILISQLALGLTLSTKFFFGSLPLVGALLLTTVFTGDFRRFLRHTIAFAFIFVGYALGHLTYFFYHLNPLDFIRYQRYLISWWAGSSQVPPFQVFDLIFNNRWHTWWGNEEIVAVPQWRLSWPIITALSVVSLPLAIYKKHLPALTLCFWLIPTFFLYSFSAIFPRHLLFVFPALYLLPVSFLPALFSHHR